MARPTKFSYPCRFCDNETYVNTTHHLEDGEVLRRHKCDKCNIMYVVKYKNNGQLEEICAYKKHTVEIIK